MVTRPTHHRFEALDGLRGIFALVVAMFHFNILWHGFDTPLLNASGMAVDFFFILSGFVITHATAGKLATQTDIKRFVVRRFGRLWPLHAATLAAIFANELIKLALQHVGMQANNAPFDPAGQNPLSAIPAHLLLLHSMGTQSTYTWNIPSWSISAEFYTYLLFALITVTVALRYKNLVMAATLAAAAGVMVMCTDTLFSATYQHGIFRCIFGFFVGHFVYLAWQHKTKLTLRFATGMEAICIVLMLAFAAFTYQGKLSQLAPLVLALPVWLFAYQQGAFSRALQIPALQKLGLWSYSIYMVHMVVLIYLSQVLTVIEKITRTNLHAQYLQPTTGKLQEVISLGNIWATDMLMLGYLAVVIITAAVTYHLVEVPARDAFNAWAKRIR